VTVTNNKIDLSGANQEARDNFSSFSEHDVSKSKGADVSIISLNKKYWTGKTKNDSYDLSESIYHEMYAHIKSTETSSYQQHKEYGNFYSGLKSYYPKITKIDNSGNYPVEITIQREWKVPEGSPYYRIREQLLQIKNAKKSKQ